MKAVEANFLKFLKKSDQLEVPIYQRTYSWTRQECLQLWSDIVRASHRDASAHFIGSIVYIDTGVRHRNLRNEGWRPSRSWWAGSVDHLADRLTLIEAWAGSRAEARAPTRRVLFWRARHSKLAGGRGGSRLGEGRDSRPSPLPSDLARLQVHHEHAQPVLGLDDSKTEREARPVIGSALHDEQIARRKVLATSDYES